MCACARSTSLSDPSAVRTLFPPSFPIYLVPLCFLLFLAFITLSAHRFAIAFRYIIFPFSSLCCAFAFCFSR